MILPLHSDPPPLAQGEDGVVRIAGTRIPLERIVRAFLVGGTPEQIAQDYDTLSVKTVYAVVNYYLHHQAEVDEYLAEADREATAIRSGVEQTWPPAGIRARLLARRSGKAT
jgi:uncharacterized protein (DUF433 family)